MPLSWIYSKITGFRNRRYDREPARSLGLGARTISVGNLTTGGTGKTPLVGYIARVLIDRGEKVCILTRGYKRADPKSRVVVSDGEKILAAPADAGDEPFELANKLNGKAVIVADADRISAGKWAKDEFGITAFILDDGFQHRQVMRDLDIVCIDATDPWGGGAVLPFGRLRESRAGLARADVVVITRADLADKISDLKFEIAKLNPQAIIFEAKNRVTACHSLLGGEELPLDDLINVPVLAFCGIGNSRSFFELLLNEGVKIAAIQAYADHYAYSQKEIVALEKKAAEMGAERLMTTAKDAVKLSALKFEMPCFVVEIEVLIKRAGEFERLI